MICIDSLGINDAKLKELIDILDKNNDDINQTMQNITYKFKSLDETIWKSPERKKIDEQLIPYLEQCNTIIYNNLLNCNKKLNDALLTHISTDEDLSKKANELAS